MFVVHYFENKNLVVSHLVQTLPALDQDVRLKGRKGKILKITNIDERNVHVQVTLEKKSKNKLLVDDSKKKRR